jgi:hypothetical protein
VPEIDHEPVRRRRSRGEQSVSEKRGLGAQGKPDGFECLLGNYLNPDEAMLVDMQAGKLGMVVYQPENTVWISSMQRG